MNIVLPVLMSILCVIGGLLVFYVLIVPRIRTRIEDDARKTMQDDLSSLITEFNRSAVEKITLLEHRIAEMRELFTEMNSVPVKSLERKSASGKAETRKRTAVSGTETRDDAPYSHIPAEQVSAVYRRAERQQTEPSFAARVHDDGLSVETKTVEARVIALYEEGVNADAIAVRVGLSVGEVEAILGFAGRM